MSGFVLRQLYGRILKQYRGKCYVLIFYAVLRITFREYFFLMADTVLFKFQTFALKQEVREIGENCRLQNGLNLHCRV